MNVTELQISWAAAGYIQHATVQAPNLSRVFATRSGHVIIPIIWPIQNGGPQPAVGPRRESPSELQVNISRHPSQKLRYREAMARKPSLANGDNLHVVRYVNGANHWLSQSQSKLPLENARKCEAYLDSITYVECWVWTMYLRGICFVGGHQ